MAGPSRVIWPLDCEPSLGAPLARSESWLEEPEPVVLGACASAVAHFESCALCEIPHFLLAETDAEPCVGRVVLSGDSLDLELEERSGAQHPPDFTNVVFDDSLARNVLEDDIGKTEVKSLA